MTPKSATPIPRSSLNFTFEELGSVLVKHWRENNYPVMGTVAVAVAAADAVKKAAETWQCTPQEAAERIKAKQELWLQSTLGNSDTPKPARWWYRDGYWLNTPAEWERREANLTGTNSESRANELETESEHNGKEVPEG